MARLKFNKQTKAQAEALLRSMSLAQKIGQMTQAERTTCTPDEVREYHLGSVLSAAGSCPKDNHLNDWLEMCDAYWYASTYKDDKYLGIPILYGVDAIHGNSNVKGAVVFPHNIGLGATGDFALIKDIAKMTASEALAAGADWVFAPNLAVAKDYHWGRTYESFSEDPRQVSKFATAMVKGLQQKFGNKGILACVKHWVGDGGTQNGIDQGNTILDWPQLQSEHVFPYYAALDAGAMTVMVSFSSWNGEKCHAHKYLITDVLKNAMNFEGLLLSDMQGIDYLADDFYLAVAQGVNAGIDMFMVPDNWKLFIEHLSNHVELGTVPMERIDDAVRRIISVKIASGQFSKPAPSARLSSNSKTFGSSTHRQVARKAVQKSLVLLKNNHDILPLDKSKRLLITGKNAHCKGSQCGGFTITWQGAKGNNELPEATSIWEGIQNVAPAAQLVPEDKLNAISNADFDAAIVVVGESPYSEGHGDIRDNDKLVIQSGLDVNGELSVFEAAATSLSLQYMCPEDFRAISALHQKGIPVVTVLITGRPLLVEAEYEHSDAFVVAWLPGSEGQGIADVLFNQAPVTGKLAFNWPHSLSSINSQSKPKTKHQFPVGYGRSYKKRGFFKSATQ